MDGPEPSLLFHDCGDDPEKYLMILGPTRVTEHPWNVQESLGSRGPLVMPMFRCRIVRRYFRPLFFFQVNGSPSGLSKDARSLFQNP